MIMIIIIMNRYSLLIPFLMKNNQLKTKIIQSQIPITKRIYHLQMIFNQNHLTNTPHFRINRINKKSIIPPEKINLIFMTTITILIPEDALMTDTISTHNHEKIIDFSLVKRTLLHFLKNPAE